MPKEKLQSLRYQVGDYIIGRTLGEVKHHRRTCRHRDHPVSLGVPHSCMPPMPQGTYAKVKYGQHAETGEPVAIKASTQ